MLVILDELHLTDVVTSIEGLSAAGPSARTLRDPGGSNLRASVNVTVPVWRGLLALVSPVSRR
jgi:hypothetical protein